MPARALLSLAAVALAKGPTVPDHQIPPAVLAELQLLENRFDLALAMDCAPTRCFSKGCTYLDHAVADRPRTGSLPGLGEDQGPGSVEPQEYLTRARCSFAHEQTLEPGDAQSLARRLQAKLSGGWTVVTVDNEALQPLPAYLREPPQPEVAPAPEPAAPTPPQTPEELTAALAGHQLWATLLPHFYWMIAIGLGTLAAATLIWSWRRLGRVSVEEQALLAQLAQPEPAAPAPAEVSAEEPADDAAFVAEQEAAWRSRLDAMAAGEPDAEVQALVRELLRAGEIPLLAKAVLRFPGTLLAAFPAGGDIAAAKLELAEFLQTAEPARLPSDREFFEALNRHTLAASLKAQGDARVVRSLREDFGAAGLVDLIGRLPARVGALVFALAPPEEQHEMVRLLSAEKAADLAEQLLLSNRMDKDETACLFEVLRAGPSDAPPALRAVGVSDRGATFDAAGALAVLLPWVEPGERAALFQAALQRFQGTVPAWYRGILAPYMLLALGAEARADLFLEVEAEPLAAWLSLVDATDRQRLLDAMPASLRASLSAAAVFPSRARQAGLARRAARELARGFQRQLARAGVAFESTLVAAGP